MSRADILIVDDQPENLLILGDLLGDLYEVRTASSGSEALDELAKQAPDLILLDIVMPAMDGFTVLSRIKSTPAVADVPVIFLTGLGSPTDEARGLQMGAVDFIHKPLSAAVVLARVRHHLELHRATVLLRNRNDDLERLVAMRTAEVVRQSGELVRREQRLVAAQYATITAFCSLAEARDDETGNHILRTQHYVKVIAEQLRPHPRFAAELQTPDAVDLLYRSAALHDIGKVAIPDAILMKPGKLTPDEWVVMKRHTLYGRSAILQAERALDGADAAFLRVAREIAYSHHEKWDGTGYPEGRAGDAIPVAARIMAVADVYDALTTRRVYKDAFPHEQAMGMISEQSGRHFDPQVAGAALDLADEFRAISRRFADDEPITLLG